MRSVKTRSIASTSKAAHRCPTTRATVAARRGFTLVEIAIVVAVAGVLLAIALPASARVQQTMRLENAAEQIARDLARARSEAIRNNAPVSFVRTGSASYQLGSASRQLPEPVRFLESSTGTVQFAPFGPPATGAASLVIELAGKTRTIAVTAGGLITTR